MRSSITILMSITILLCTGCIRDKAVVDIASSAKVIDNAAQSLPDGPAVQAIRANAQAILRATGENP